MKLPSIEYCFKLMHEMGMMEHIIHHSIQVCRVATFIADTLKKQDIPIQRELIIVSSLLHDITKTRSFKTKENHAETGATLLKKLGYPQVGYIIGQHVRLERYSFETLPYEAEIVNYADKRVLHDQIVSLKERMNYILKRYGKDKESRNRIKWLWDQTIRLEEKIFRYMLFPPDNLPILIENKDSLLQELIDFFPEIQNIQQRGNHEYSI